MTETQEYRTSPSARYQRRYLLDQLRGVPHTPVPTDRVRDHVLTLISGGLSVRSIGEAAGVCPTTVRSIASGRYATTHRRVEAKLLRVTPSGVIEGRARPDDRVPATGAVRRVRALLALGHTHAVIRELTGVPTEDLTRSRRVRWVTLRVHQGVEHAYSVLSMTPGASARTRTWALNRGYAPPLAWDDDTIDDPKAKSSTGRTDDPWSVDDAVVERVLAGRAQPTNPREREVIVTALVARGVPDRDIAALCQVWPETILRIRKRLHVGGRYAA